MANKHSHQKKLARNRILVVEDDPDISNKLLSCLAGEGYLLRAVECGREALAASEEWVPSLILLDMSLPDMYGLEVFIQLRTNERTRRIPVVFLGGDDVLINIRPVEFGPADDYIAKPLEIEDLRWRVRRAIETLAGLNR